MTISKTEDSQSQREGLHVVSMMIRRERGEKMKDCQKGNNPAEMQEKKDLSKRGEVEGQSIEARERSKGLAKYVQLG